MCPSVAGPLQMRFLVPTFPVPEGPAFGGQNAPGASRPQLGIAADISASATPAHPVDNRNAEVIIRKPLWVTIVCICFTVMTTARPRFEVGDRFPFIDNYAINARSPLGISWELNVI